MKSLSRVLRSLSGLLLHQHFGPREEVDGHAVVGNNFHFDKEIDLVGSEVFDGVKSSTSSLGTLSRIPCLPRRDCAGFKPGGTC